MKTSWSDRLEYTDICKLFCEDDEIFNSFRDYNQSYNEVLEHVNSKMGRDYLDIALINVPTLQDSMAEFLRNDEVGKPTTFYFQRIDRECSPTTLRYIKVLSDLIGKDLITKTEPQTVVEIGGGYGGQCRIIHAYNPNVKYYIVDLKEPLMLQEKYLARFGITNVTFITPEEVIIRRLRESNDDRSYKGQSAIENYYRRKPLHVNLEIPIDFK